MPNSDDAKPQSNNAKKQEEKENTDLNFLKLALKPSWKTIKKTEQPDFIIENCDGSKFGLELTNIFQGGNNRKGSKLHKKEKTNDNSLQKIREECVKLFPFCSEYSLDWGIKKFDEEKARNIIESIMYDIKDKCNGKIGSVYFSFENDKIEEFNEKYINTSPIKQFIFVKKNKYDPKWRVLSDFLPLEHEGNREIQNCIDEKSKKLSSYKEDINEVNLLITAYSFLNTSQSIEADKNFFPDLKGFDTVYFSYMPYYVIEYSSIKKRKVHIVSYGGPTSQQLANE